MGNGTRLDISALETWLWETACVIRGPIDAPKYKDYILPLIFLKRLSAQARVRMLASRGVSQANISASKLKGFQVPLPPIEEQDRISTSLCRLDQKIETEEKRKAALQALFKSMLHHLMTGKIRVPESV